MTKPRRIYLRTAEIKPEDSNVVWVHLTLDPSIDDLHEARAVMQHWAYMQGGFDASVIGEDLFLHMTTPQELKSLEERLNWALDLLEQKGVIL